MAYTIGDLSPAEAAAQIRFLEEEVALLERKIAESPRHVRILEQRLAESAGRLAQLSARNESLTETLNEARAQLVELSEEVDQLAQPISGYGVVLARFPDRTLDVFTSGRRMRVPVSPVVDVEELHSGQTVHLDDAGTVVGAADFEAHDLSEVLSELIDIVPRRGEAPRGQRQRAGREAILLDDERSVVVVVWGDGAVYPMKNNTDSAGDSYGRDENYPVAGTSQFPVISLPDLQVSGFERGMSPAPPGPQPEDPVPANSARPGDRAAASPARSPP